MRHLTVFFLLFLLCFTKVQADGKPYVRISTDKTDLIFQIADNGRFYQLYLGAALSDESEFQNLPDHTRTDRWEAYPVSGTEDYFEPAFAIRHNDGNPASVFNYVSHEVKKIDNNVTETIVLLRDKVYPVEVKLYYTAFAKENIIKLHTEIVHQEKNPVVISRYASSMLYLENPSYYLTEFSGDWAKEAQMSTQELKFGKKIIDTKLGSRAAMFAYPFFELGLDAPARENEGDVLMGTISWTGNYRFTFEVDNFGYLRVISGINPYASDYELKPKEVFSTPEFVFTLSHEGTGKGSRNFHDWAINYQLRDGKGDRYTLLNNWENTYFDFDEKKLGELMQEANQLGVDLFLLDDGWFGNKYPRKDDHAGLGDWEVTHSKLPNGIPHLVKKAQEAGVKFGIWIEPEMVNPKSELFEKHPDWVIHLPNREMYFFRNQLVLDLSNPQVQNYVFSIVDNLMIENPDIAFFKWDCNSPITNIYSPYLKNKQSQLYIDYVRGTYNVFSRVKEKYPNMAMMLCSGGGGRCDYEALKYFTEFWCSDNTDPVERLYIQWGFSQFFPAKAMCAHVTSWNKNASLKFRVDVAMMCKLGFDIGLKEMTDNELTFCKEAITNYKRLTPVILNGELYRLVSPYDSNHTSVMQVSKDKNKATLFAFDIYPRYGEKLFSVKLQGLDPNKRYRIKEINLMPGAKSSFKGDNKVYSGNFLLIAGLKIFTASKTNSRVFELTAE